MHRVESLAGVVVTYFSAAVSAWSVLCQREHMLSS